MSQALNLLYVAGMYRDHVISTLRAHRDELLRLGVRELYLFGSAARDEVRPDSDIDVMVDLDEGPSGRKALFTAFDIGAIQYALAAALGRPVDLVVRSDALRPGHRLQDIAAAKSVAIFVAA